MTVNRAAMALGLICLAVLGCASAQPAGTDDSKCDDVSPPILPEWGPPRVEYQYRAPRGQHTRVAIYDIGSLCFTSGTPPRSILDARFDLNQLRPRGWSLDKESGDALLQFELRTAIKKEEEHAREAPPRPPLAEFPCIVIDVYADPREGDSHCAAVALGHQRGRLLEKRIRSMAKYKDVTIRSHGWQDTAIESTSAPPQARAQIQIDPTCTLDKTRVGLVHITVHHQDMREMIAALQEPISSLTSASFHAFGSHGPTRSFTWNPPADGAADPPPSKRLFPQECSHIAPTTTVRPSSPPPAKPPSSPRKTVIDFSNADFDSEKIEDSCVVRTLDELFTAMVENGCEFRAAGM